MTQLLSSAMNCMIKLLLVYYIKNREISLEKIHPNLRCCVFAFTKVEKFRIFYSMSLCRQALCRSVSSAAQGKQKTNAKMITILRVLQDLNIYRFLLSYVPITHSRDVITQKEKPKLSLVELRRPQLKIISFNMIRLSVFLFRKHVRLSQKVKSERLHDYMSVNIVYFPA